MTIPGGGSAWVAVMRWLVRLHPARFRRTLGEDMVFTFVAEFERRRTGGGWRTTQWALATILATAWSAVAVHASEIRRTDSPMARHSLRGRDAGWSDQVSSEGRQILRGLRRAPGFSIAVLTALAVGVGANVAMFARVDALLLRPPRHLKDPGSVHRVYVERAGNGSRFQDGSFSYPGYAALATALDGKGTLAAVSSFTAFVDAGGDILPLPVEAASGSFWSLFDASPSVGGFFGESVGGSRVTVLSHAFWRSAFGGDPAVVGRTLQLGVGVYSVVGVAPPDFEGMEPSGVVAWVPLDAAGADLGYAERPGTTWLELFARTGPGLDGAVLSEILDGAFRRHRLATGESRWVLRENPKVLLAPGIRNRGPEKSVEARVSVWLLGMSLLLLGVACANVATLMLGRALRHRHENALRAALGIRTGRLVLRAVLESLVLAVGGGLVAAPVAWSLARVLDAGFVVPTGPAATVLGTRALLVGAAVVPIAGLLAALVPSLEARRAAPAGALRSGGSGAVAPRTRLQGALVAGQAALSTVLLVGTGLFVRSVANIDRLELGYAADRVAVVSTSPRVPGAGPDEAARRRLADDLARAARTVDGVTSVALSSSVPFVRNNFEAVFLEDGSRVSGSIPAATHVVSGAYFETMGTRMVRGRPLGEGDDERAPRVVVVSQALAETLWPRGDALGRCLRLGADTMPCSEVVGVAQTIRRGDIRRDGDRQYYVNWRQYFGRVPPLLLVRTHGPVAGVAESLRSQVQAAMPDVFVRVRPLEDVIAPQTRTWREGVRIFSAFGLLSLGLAAFGLFTVAHYDAAQRHREFGVRVALGAEKGAIVRLVLGRGSRLTALGVTVGIAVSWTLAPRIQGLLFDVQGRDAVALLGTVLVLGVATLAAGLAPALHAASVDPQVALRGD